MTPAGEIVERPPFVLLVAMSAIGPLALNIFMPSMPGLQRVFDVSYGTVQLTLTLYLIGMAVCQLVYGPVSDSHGRRPVVLFGLVVFVAASVFAALAPSIEALIAARLLQAVGGAAGIVLARAIVRDLYERNKAASVIAYITMAFVLAPMVAPMLGGILDQWWSWRASFWLLSGLGAAVAVAAWLALPETNLNRSPSAGAFWMPTGYGRLLKRRRFRGYSMTLAFSSGMFFCFLAGAPHVVIDVLHRTPLEYGMWFVLISLGYMAGNFISGRYTQAHGIDRMVQVGNLLTFCGGAACLAVALTGTLTPLTLFGPMMLAALGNGLTVPNGLAGAISVEPAMVGAAAGFAGFIQMGFGAAASQVVGMAQNSAPMSVFWFMAVLAALAVVSHQWTRRQPEA